ncbi:NAD(P)H:quinone oxidoreductase [Caldifermentibacillus hisashii]|jgi:NAD(P)H dehydrogenase (quinone)|uniref:NAD(P)H:quinone oxidoreductase n=1 Tax=Bacillaceae TaxID=186817 RepID=UPI001D068064|nr:MULTISPECIES: NAD(P)H:quinone oxidoreductase [Bacillaceae]MCB7069804.1 NAD(P)H:quinone oxidoreductase [Caldibacillus sp. 210928-DFI.2.22]MCB7073294.1 NAD(P)H:quinone oxidoreductase [Caldibacillus sp. 210928-DFI.2.18]MCM3055676.1 NAD(P)H:quinone oxidoreductase [Caldibacillus thermoamylovorans]MCM3479091.1 NAD(P)H:quinone oxidoreductase [Caldibacillus thermoamylovorans]MEC5272517.1 NAD(P)H:quinone oxidoreductase [Caldifermentibacillus hisashii]
MTNILVIYYSAYGHIFQMAKAVCQGAEKVHDANVKLVRIPEMDSEKNRTPYIDKEANRNKQTGVSVRFKVVDRFDKYVTALEWQKDVPIATNEDLRWADGIIWGFPTRYGSMPSQVQLFLEFATDLCGNGDLEGKPAGIFTSAGSIHTGHESTILTSMVPLFHFGMIMVGLPYSENPEYLTGDAIGSSPYGASTLAGPDGSKTPDERELIMAKRLGMRVSFVATALKKNPIQVMSV